MGPKEVSYSIVLGRVAVGGGDSQHAIPRGVCPTVQMQSRRVEEESWLERRVQVSPQRRDTNDKS